VEWADKNVVHFSYRIYVVHGTPILDPYVFSAGTEIGGGAFGYVFPAFLCMF
jgi:hypothetical protein